MNISSKNSVRTGWGLVSDEIFSNLDLNGKPGRHILLIPVLLELLILPNKVSPLNGLNTIKRNSTVFFFNLRVNTVPVMKHIFCGKLGRHTIDVDHTSSMTDETL